MRRALPLAALALGLTACAPEGEEREGASNSYPAYELASARTERAPGAVASAASVEEITVEQLSDRLAAGEIRVIDVRRDDEVAEGMIPGAEHIAMDRFDPASVVAGDDRPIVIYCRSGRRSQIVAEQLAAFTGKPATHLAGGVLAWTATGKTTVAP